MFCLYICINYYRRLICAKSLCRPIDQISTNFGNGEGQLCSHLPYPHVFSDDLFNVPQKMHLKQTEALEHTKLNGEGNQSRDV